MERYYKPARAARAARACAPTKGDVEFKIIEWYSSDVDSGSDDSDSDDATIDTRYSMRVFGVTREGQSVTVDLEGFTPFYYIKVSDTFTKLSSFVDFVQNHYILKQYSKDIVVANKCKIVKSKDIYGFTNDKVFTFVKLVFTSHKAMLRSRYIFKNPVSIYGVTRGEQKFSLYESNFEPSIRYAHIQGLHMAGWARLSKYKCATGKATTQLHLTAKHSDLVPLVEDLSSCNFLQASWDIEVYSHDGSFPSPHVKENVIFQIAVTYKNVLDPDFLVKQLLTLKKCSAIVDSSVLVEEFATETALIKRFVDSIRLMDPDIMYTYNGDSFDCMYIYERSKMLGLENYLLTGLSRLRSEPTRVVKEVFSSSAYGDSEMFRMYIPGRLNYDLMIHYKRGMKKYASYKLDSIAESILGEKKNPVSVKQIFSFYREGSPDRIREIGLYCIQDTVLLQKLVDKQRILTSITQLANVTYVPISYLLTRGQTVKVLSQIYRKARQMGYLVPHTNFNNDTIDYKLVLDRTGVFKKNDPVKLSYGHKHSSGTVKSVISSTCIEVLVNSEIDVNSGGYTLQVGTSKYTVTGIELQDSEESFSGATVLTAIPGVFDNNIAVLDFASLYPTIMISRNLCYSTFVMDEKYLGLPGIKYETIEWDDSIFVKINHNCDAVMATGLRKGKVCGKQAFFNVDTKYYCRVHDPLKKTREESEKFQKKQVHYKYTIVQPSEGKNKGVIPSLLEELYDTRKLVKKQMSKAYEAGDTVTANILNFNQMAIKISLNSTYGFLGRSKGNLILKELGSIVTSVGRMLIEQSKEYVENVFSKQVSLEHTIDTGVIRGLTESAKDMILADSFRVDY